MAEYTPAAQTSGTTPTTVNTGPGQSPDSIIKFGVFVFAWDHNAAVSYWEFRVLARRVGSAPAGGIAVQVTRANSLSAAAWTVSLAYDVEGTLVATLTGGLGQTVDWLVINEDSLGMVGGF